MRFFTKIITPVILCAGLLSCGKDDPDPVTGEKFVYNLTGTKNFNVETTSSDSMTISLTRVSGATENIRLSMKGIPENMTATFTKSEGLPPYTSKIVLRGANIPVGTYQAALVAAGISSGTQEFPVTINVFKQETNCIAPLIGIYSVSEECESAPPPYNVSVSVDPTDNKFVLLKGFASIDITLRAAIICGSNTVVIPEQTIGNNTVSGNGTFEGNKMIIDYNLSVRNPGSTTFTASCKATLRKR